MMTNKKILEIISALIPYIKKWKNLMRGIMRNVLLLTAPAVKVVWTFHKCTYIGVVEEKFS